MAKRRIQELEEPGNHRGGQDQLLDSERLEDGSHVRSVVEGMTVNDRHENAKHFPDKLLSKGAKLHKAAKHGTKFSQFAKRGLPGAARRKLGLIAHPKPLGPKP